MSKIRPHAYFVHIASTITKYVRPPHVKVWSPALTSLMQSSATGGSIGSIGLGRAGFMPLSALAPAAPPEPAAEVPGSMPASSSVLGIEPDLAAAPAAAALLPAVSTRADEPARAFGPQP